MVWDNPHEDRDDIAEQTLMITGDNNLVEVQATVRYRVADPTVYLFQVQDANQEDCSGRPGHALLPQVPRVVEVKWVDPRRFAGLPTFY